jgi:hypothetical protein
MTKTWLNAGIARFGVGVGVGVGVAVGCGVDAGVGVGVAAGLGVALGVGFVFGVGVGLLAGGGVDVACAELVGFAVGVLALPDADGVEDSDGARATGGCDMDPGVLGDPSSSDVIHKSNPPTPTQRASRRNNHMSGTPPTHH